MRQVLFSVAVFILAAFVMALLGYIIDSVELRWAILAGALGLLGAGLACNSFILTLRTDNRMKEINTTLSRIEGLQRDMQAEQKEQAKFSSPIVTLSQALMQSYIEYLSKQAEQKSGNE